MTESEGKRRFWQIHLSTAIVLMFVASALVWINLRAEREMGVWMGNVGWSGRIISSCGWPLTACVITEAVGFDSFPESKEQRSSLNLRDIPERLTVSEKDGEQRPATDGERSDIRFEYLRCGYLSEQPQRNWLTLGVVADVLTLAAMLLGLGLALECAIGRASRRR